jgi:2-alkyl-3-oxoalkanoate reductase
VLVTGYGGFLGSEICRQLVAAGYAVNGLARNRYELATKLGINAFQGDATDPEIVHQAMQGCDAVIHTAALAGVAQTPHRFELANVKATQVMLDVAKQSKVAAFVHCSSPSVVFEGTADGIGQCNVDESHPYPKRFLADYPRTKAISERLVLESRHSMAVCALRPHLIWGHGDNHLTPRLVDRMRRGRLRVVGNGKNVIDTVHVEYAARTHVQALEILLREPASINGRSFFINDGNPIGCWDWIATILREFDLRPPTKTISLRTAYRLGHSLELIYRTCRLSDEPPMTRFVALQLGVDHYYDITAAREMLGFKPLMDRSLRSIR